MRIFLGTLPAWLLIFTCSATVPVVRAEDDDLFSEEAKPAAEISKPSEVESAVRQSHTRPEIKAALLAQNRLLAEQLTEFIAVNKQLARQSLENEALMKVFREYGPAVIRMKHRWQAVVGNPVKYDNWLGSKENVKAWKDFHQSWNQLFPYIDQFAATDIELADKLTDALTGLGRGFEEYSDWTDEWDQEIGNGGYTFARTAEETTEQELGQAEALEDKEAADTTNEISEQERQMDIEEADTDKEIKAVEEASESKPEEDAFDFN